MMYVDLEDLATAVSTILQQEERSLRTKLSGHQGEPEQKAWCHSIRPSQQALRLRTAKEEYALVEDHDVPVLLYPNEILVKIAALGLGLRARPSGVVVKTSPSYSSSTRIQLGDLVLVPSTDYRDIRKAPFQEYAVAAHYNSAKIRFRKTSQSRRGVPVCFVADFSNATAVPGPNLIHILERIDRSSIPDDIAGERFPTGETRQVKQGDWIAIWGASTTTGYVTLQLARQCRLRIICVADTARDGRKLQEAAADLLIDRYDTRRAIDIIRGTATILQEALCTSPDTDSPPAHLLGLTGLPILTDRHPGIRYHTVPIKLFHLCEPVAEDLMSWLECQLEKKPWYRRI
ncbi:uncharacterized protein BDV17DRAFT_298125 [Aspergillus undulatus]|uniref:uncharacterized protein n=1 Tax=Aspergillus undulatus TaxID=1810928 RepID=UPI003CCE148B